MEVRETLRNLCEALIRILMGNSRHFFQQCGGAKWLSNKVSPYELNGFILASSWLHAQALCVPPTVSLLVFFRPLLSLLLSPPSASFKHWQDGWEVIDRRRSIVLEIEPLREKKREAHTPQLNQAKRREKANSSSSLINSIFGQDTQIANHLNGCVYLFSLSLCDCLLLVLLHCSKKIFSFTLSVCLLHYYFDSSQRLPPPVIFHHSIRIIYTDQDRLRRTDPIKSNQFDQFFGRRFDWTPGRNWLGPLFFHFRLGKLSSLFM